MLEVDCAPNLVVYHALIAALGRAGRWEEALQVRLCRFYRLPYQRLWMMLNKGLLLIDWFYSIP